MKSKTNKLKNKMYLTSDRSRIFEEEYILQPEPYRTQFYRDYARIIHSPCLRRLQGKTQLFPSHESDFFRNRLTHSLEVAQIAKSIANRINHLIKTNYGNTDAESLIDTDLVQFAGLAHDLGHPPFGHQGESELDSLMEDFGGFEGNAQTLRILTKLEKKEKEHGSRKFGFQNGKDERFGLNLTYRTLASVLKYDYKIPLNMGLRNADKAEGKNPTGKTKPAKGYYIEEESIVQKIKENVLRGATAELKTVEMQIMDIADDIAYSTYDFEDSLKGGFINALDLLTIEDEILQNMSGEITRKLRRNIDTDTIKEIIIQLFDDIIADIKFQLDDSELIEYFRSGEISNFISGFVYNNSKEFATNGYSRNSLTSRWVGMFIRSVNIEYNEENPALSRIYIDNEMKEADHSIPNVDLKIEVLKRFTYEFQITSNKLKIAEDRGRDIVKTIFNKIITSDGDFLPQDFRNIYKHIKVQISDNHKREQMLRRTVCDFIASMTDRYCIEFYGRLKSENPQSIFKTV